MSYLWGACSPKWACPWCPRLERMSQVIALSYMSLFLRRYSIAVVIRVRMDKWWGLAYLIAGSG